MTPEQIEAEKAHDAYRMAIMQLGAQVAVQSLNAFQSVSVANAASLSAYGAAMAALIYRFRKQARNMAMALYQYERALLTGEAVKDWSVKDQGETLSELRGNFVAHIEKLGVKAPQPTKQVNLRVKVKWVDSPELKKAEQIADGLLDAEIDTTMEIVGKRRADRAILKAKRSKDLKSVEKIHKEAKDEIQVKLTQAVERMAMDGARNLDNNVIKFDKRVIGYTRIHDPLKQDTPCGWCSMLMTRGFTSASGLYTKETAGAAPGEEGFHSGCHCTAVKVYDRKQLSSEKFAKNKEYAKLWPKVTSGHYGKEALSVWRKYMRDNAVPVEQPKQEAQTPVAA